MRLFSFVVILFVKLCVIARICLQNPVLFSIDFMLLGTKILGICVVKREHILVSYPLSTLLFKKLIWHS